MQTVGEVNCPGCGDDYTEVDIERFETILVVDGHCRACGNIWEVFIA